MKAEIKAEFDAVANFEDAENLVNKYGTHFLSQAIYGGRWKFTQSLSSLTMTTSTSREAEVSTKYQNYLSTNSGVSQSTGESSTYDTSAYYFRAKGGKTSLIQEDYTPWAQDIEQNGNMVMVRFAEESDTLANEQSLLRISVLAKDATTKSLIDQAIENAFPLADSLKSLAWEKSEMVVVHKEDYEIRLLLDDPNEIVIGIGADASKKEAKKLGFKIYNLDSKKTYWRLANDYGKDGEIQEGTPSFESKTTIPAGAAVTGLGMSANDGKVKKIPLYYQYLDPTNTMENGYLDSTVKREGSSDSQRSYQPDDTNRKVVVGVSFRIKSEKVKGLEVYIAPLEKVLSS